LKFSIKILDFSLEKILISDSDKDIYQNLEYMEFMKLIDTDKLRFLSVSCGPNQIFLIDSKIKTL